ASLADIAVAVPFIDRALAGRRAGEGALHGGVEMLVGRPRAPLVEVVDVRDDLLRRRIDGGRALDAEFVGLPRREDKDNGHRRDDDDDETEQYPLQHDAPSKV